MVEVKLIISDNVWEHECVCVCVCVCVFLASGYGWGTVMHEIPISSAHLVDIPSIP